MDLDRVAWDRLRRAASMMLIAALSACAGSAPAASPDADQPSASPSSTGDPAAGAVPGILQGAQARAADRAAQNAARNGLVAAEVLAIDTGSYGTATPDGLAEIEPTLRFVRGRASTGPEIVSFLNSDHRITVAVASATGACFALRMDATEGIAFATQAHAASCRPAIFNAEDFGESW